MQCDPLALIVRSDWTFEKDSAMAASVAPNATEPRVIDALPALPLAVALTIDVRSIGGVAAMNDLLSDFASPLPEWINDLDAVAIGVGPNTKLGLLSDAAIIARSSRPATLRDAIERELESAGRNVTIDSSNAGASPQAFSIAPPPADSALSHQTVLEGLAFGPSGAKGLLHASESELVFALSQRPALLAAFASPSERLTDTAAVGIMRQWMPVHRDIEAYIGMAQMATLINAAAASLLQPAIALPAFDDHAPPVGFAADVTGRGVVSSMIVPSGVLAPLFDEALRRMRIANDKDAEQP
jgi:hypothetical protein